MVERRPAGAAFFMPNRSSQRKRLDVLLVERGLCDSREKAQRAVMAGTIRVNGHRATKPGQSVREKDELSMASGERFVSRGGLKLDHALDSFNLDVTGWRVLDLGASTGGFTDCLLQAGAGRVYAVDVGAGQLAWKLRQDPRVLVMEKTNARNLTLNSFEEGFEPVDLVAIDCSFISLRKILPPAALLLRSGGFLVALIKPQFEAGKQEADKGRGVIKDPAIHHRVIEEMRDFVRHNNNLVWHKVIESPILGPAGNKEFLVLIEKIQ